MHKDQKGIAPLSLSLHCCSCCYYPHLHQTAPVHTDSRAHTLCPHSSVRSAAHDCLQELYKVLGPSLVASLQQQSMRPAVLREVRPMAAPNCQLGPKFQYCRCQRDQSFLITANAVNTLTGVPMCAGGNWTGCHCPHSHLLG